MGRPGDTINNFWEKVDKRSKDECWEWIASLGTAGYGQFWDGQNRVGAHRFSYELHIGPIPTGLTIDHLCRNRRCVNPYHMEPVTRGENTLRGTSPSALAARTTHCPSGHRYSKENTYIYPNGNRRCRICHREQNKRYYHVRKNRNH